MTIEVFRVVTLTISEKDNINIPAFMLRSKAARLGETSSPNTLVA